jgi:hypothetical protein
MKKVGEGERRMEVYDGVMLLRCRGVEWAQFKEIVISVPNTKSTVRRVQNRIQGFLGN